jgi:hypothetical protein
MSAHTKIDSLATAQLNRTREWIQIFLGAQLNQVEKF